MADIEIDCAKYRGQCDELRRVVLEGLSPERLERLGVEPGSDRALRLEHGMWDIFLRCCARLSGPAPPLRPVLPEPPPAPGPPPPVPPAGAPEDQTPPVLAGTLVLAAERSLVAELLAYLRSLPVPVHPLVLLIIVAAVFGAATRTQTCRLVRTRINTRGERECLYRCPNGTMYYQYDFFGVTCLPFIVKPV